MTEYIVTHAPPTAQPVVVCDGLIDLAYRFGHLDATEGKWADTSLMWAETYINAYMAGYAAGLAQVRILCGDPMLARWVLAGAPAGGFDWNQDFGDVVAAEDRDDYVGA